MIVNKKITIKTYYKINKNKIYNFIKKSIQLSVTVRGNSDNNKKEKENVLKKKLIKKLKKIQPVKKCLRAKLTLRAIYSVV